MADPRGLPGGRPGRPATLPDRTRRGQSGHLAVRVEATPLGSSVAGGGGQQVGLSVGTAVVVQPASTMGYYIVTAYHVVERAKNIRFRLPDGSGTSLFWGSPLSREADLRERRQGPRDLQGRPAGRPRGHDPLHKLIQNAVILDTSQYDGDASALGRTAVAVGESRDPQDQPDGRFRQLVGAGERRLRRDGLRAAEGRRTSPSDRPQV